MRKTRRLLSGILSIVMLLCLFPTAAFAAEATGISINPTRNLAVGDSKPLILTAQPAGAALPAIRWSSGNEKVATVDENGVVTGVKTGLVTITATAERDPSLTASVELVVRSVYNYAVDWSGSFTAGNNCPVTTAPLPVEPSRIEKAWAAKVGSGTLAIVDDWIYTYDGYDFNGDTTKGGTLYKLRRDTGEIVDSMHCQVSSGNYYCYTIYGGGLLYVAGVGKVMAVDPDSFTVLWYADAPSVYYPVVQFVNGCLLTNGAVLEGNTGKRLATLPGTYNYSSGVEQNGVFYIASGEGVIYAFDTATWQVKDSKSFRTGTKSLQPGVLYYGGRLYWGESSGGTLYSIRIDSTTGGFAADSLITNPCGITTVCTPAAAEGRVYLAGTRNEGGVVGVFRAADLANIYVAEGANAKIQSSPVIRTVSSDGPVIMSLGGAQPMALSDGTYVIVQDYGDGNTEQQLSRLYVLKDTETTTSAGLTPLATLDPADFAYQQLAFDKAGGLYCTNDAGYLIRYRNAAAAAPVFTKDLSTAEVRYGQGAEVTQLTVAASVPDGGTLTYQWQSRTETGVWTALAGETSPSCSPSSAALGTLYYRCVVTNTLEGQQTSAISRIAKITVVEGGALPESPTLCGDVNGDGKVNAKDVTTLRRHIAGWPGYEAETIRLDHADVNADGKVNAKDSTTLARYVAGWPGVTIG